MRALFRSLPWNSHRGRETSARTWLQRLLIVVAFLLTVFSADWIVRKRGVIPLYFLAGGIGLAIFSVRPHLILFFAPVLLVYPRTLPRLFERIGIMEVFIPLTVTAWAVNVISHRRQIRTNGVLKLALLAAVPVVGSAAMGRGELDVARMSTWLSGCGIYLLALNVGQDRRTAEKMLLWIALVIVGVVALDFLLHGWLPILRDIASSEALLAVTYGDYRKTASGIGQNNFTAGLLAIVTPIPMAYALLAPGRRQRRVCVVVIFLSTLLGVLMLSRTFWVGTGIGLVAQAYAIWKKKRGRYVLVALLLAVVSVGVILLLLPTMSDLMVERLARTFGLRGGYEGAADPRLERSITQLRWAARSPLWGHGAGALSGRAHSLIPIALYDYGLAFTLPLLGVLGLWLRQAIRLVKESDQEQDLAFSLAHLGVVVGMVAVMLFSDWLITNVGYNYLAFLIAGLLGATVSGQEYETVSGK